MGTSIAITSQLPDTDGLSYSGLKSQQLQRCLCTAHRCNEMNVGDQPGALIEAYAFRRHALDEKKATMMKIAEEAQNIALSTHHKNIERSLAQLTARHATNSETEPLKEVDQFRIDKTRRLVKILSDVGDRIDQLTQEVD